MGAQYPTEIMLHEGVHCLGGDNGVCWLKRGVERSNSERNLSACAERNYVPCLTSVWTQISIPPLQVRGALSGGWVGCLCQWELKAPTDRSRSDCVHEQVAKRIANVRFTPGCSGDEETKRNPQSSDCRKSLLISAIIASLFTKITKFISLA